ncbi:MAG: DUF302 domain-containing protein [Candidatus Rokuibacteriota bacterium]
MSVRTRAAVALPLALLAASTAAPAQDGAVVLTSKAPFGTTVAALERAVAEQQMLLVCRADAQRGAAARGVRIPGNQVFMVLRNDFAVRLINAEPRAAYEASSRLYVSENRDGTATLVYVKPSMLFRPSGIRRWPPPSWTRSSTGS